MIDYKLVRFLAIILFSLVALVIGILGLTGVLDRGNQAYYSSLITLVIGVWLKFPRASKARNAVGALFDQGSSPSDSPLRDA
jgi:hypothetical protein